MFFELKKRSAFFISVSRQRPEISFVFYRLWRSFL